MIAVAYIFIILICVLFNLEIGQTIHNEQYLSLIILIFVIVNLKCKPF